MEKSIFCGREKELGILWREWRRATETDGHPQVVVLLADNGLGKTRLVQEFFGQLSTSVDRAGQDGYWPDELELSGDNLRVNPRLELCNPAHEPPYLWWGLRFAEVERRNAAIAGMDETLPDLAAHLAVLLGGVRNEERRRRVLKSLGDAASDFGLEAAGALLPHVSLAKTSANFLLRLWGIGREHVAGRAVPSLPGLRQSEQISKAERIVGSLGQVLAARGDCLPICIFADDGHFSDADPDTVDLLRRLLDAARADRWPLLLLITHWHDRWNADASDVARWLKPQADRIILLPFGKLKAQALSPVLAQHLPGLMPDQSDAILSRADGNPQFLEEIILFMKENEGLFVAADPKGALTSDGIKEVMQVTVGRHELNRRRLRDLPKPACGALAIGSLQGQRLLQDVTAEVCATVGFTDGAAVEAGLAAAEMPYNLIKREGMWAEFLQRLYREIAEQDMRNIPLGRAAVQSGLIVALRRRVSEPERLAELPREDRLATLGLAWALLRDAPEEADASVGATAAVALISERFAARDYLGAGAQAKALVDTMRARMAQ